MKLLEKHLFVIFKGFLSYLSRSREKTRINIMIEIY